jgi:hypothetical protein
VTVLITLIKTVTQEVIKVQNHTVTHTVTVKVPGGAETTTTDTTDLGTMEANLQTSSEILKEKIVTQNGVSIGIFALSDLKLTKPDYGVLIDIPMASKVSIFVTGDTAKRIGAGIKVQF